MPDEVDEFPAIGILACRVLRSECRHSCETHAVVNNVVELTIRQVLSLRPSHVRWFRIQTTADIGIAATIVRMACRAMVGEMSHSFGQNLRSGRNRILRLLCGSRNRQSPQMPRNKRFDRRRLTPRAEAVGEYIPRSQSDHQQDCNYN